MVFSDLSAFAQTTTGRLFGKVDDDTSATRAGSAFTTHTSPPTPLSFHDEITNNWWSKNGHVDVKGFSSDSGLLPLNWQTLAASRSASDCDSEHCVFCSVPLRREEAT
jgi:hypothetical protein